MTRCITVTQCLNRLLHVGVEGHGRKRVTKPTRVQDLLWVRLEIAKIDLLLITLH